jgi:hypothetical protein
LVSVHKKMIWKQNIVGLTAFFRPSTELSCTALGGSEALTVENIAPSTNVTRKCRSYFCTLKNMGIFFLILSNFSLRWFTFLN